MMCYKDRVYCPFWKECKFGNGCHRALTTEVEELATQCGLLISRFGSKPNCFKEKGEVDEKR